MPMRLPLATNHSVPQTAADKVKLFRALFRGRPEVFATRFVSKKTSALSKSTAAEIRTAVLSKSAQASAPFPPNLGWTHYLVLLRVTNPTARAFYEIESVRERWSSRELERQIASLLFERLAKSRDKEKLLALARRGHEVRVPGDVLKDPFVLEFLGLDERVPLECDYFYVDLVFYNRLLRRFVLVDLKLGKLTHQDLGQMQMYVNFFDRFQRAEHEAQTIGIVLCSEKNDAMARITLPENNEQILAARYQMYLPTEEELRAELAREREEAERALRLAVEDAGARKIGQ